MLTARTKLRFPFQPDYAVPPGRTLQETIDYLGIDQRELAARTGLTPKTINLIINGKAALTPETAIKLERVTGVPARMWNNLEANYRGQLARQDSKEELSSQLKWLAQIPTKELVSRGAIEPCADQIRLLERVLSFFGVASVEAWREGWSKPQFAFRKSIAVAGKVGALATWLRLAELSAQKVECQPFDSEQFREALTTIRDMTTVSSGDFIERMAELCASSGVAVALVPEIQGAPVNGAAKWLTESKAMIALNLRGKSNDKFWFSFFHEAGHLLNDSKKELFLDIAYDDDPREHSANEFARKFLIPPQHDRTLKSLRTKTDVVRFAKVVGIAPGIVVGRLQWEKLIPHSHLNGLKVPFRWRER